MNCKQVWGSRSQFFAQPPELLQPGKTALDSPAFGHRVEDVGLLILTIRAATVLAKNVFDVLREGPTHAAAIAQQALRPAQAALAASRKKSQRAQAPHSLKLGAEPVWLEYAGDLEDIYAP